MIVLNIDLYTRTLCTRTCTAGRFDRTAVGTVYVCHVALTDNNSDRDTLSNKTSPLNKQISHSNTPIVFHN